MDKAAADKIEKEIEEIETEGERAFDALYDTLFVKSSPRKTKHGLSISPDAVLLERHMRKFLSTRIKLHNRMYDKMGIIMTEMENIDTSKMNDEARESLATTIGLLSHIKGNSLDHVVSLSMLEVLTWAVFSLVLKDKSIRGMNGHASSLKNLKKDISGLEDREANKTASVNTLIWENWKKRGIL